MRTRKHVFDLCLTFIICTVLQGGLQQSLDNSTIFGAAIVGLLSGAGCIYFIERTRGLTQGEWLQFKVKCFS